MNETERRCGLAAHVSLCFIEFWRNPNLILAPPVCSILGWANFKRKVSPTLTSIADWAFLMLLGLKFSWIMIMNLFETRSISDNKDKYNFASTSNLISCWFVLVNYTSRLNYHGLYLKDNGLMFFHIIKTKENPGFISYYWVIHRPYRPSQLYMYESVAGVCIVSWKLSYT